jgi:hypothetical protein
VGYGMRVQKDRKLNQNQNPHLAALIIMCIVPAIVVLLSDCTSSLSLLSQSPIHVLITSSRQTSHVHHFISSQNSRNKTWYSVVRI